MSVVVASAGAWYQNNGRMVSDAGTLADATDIPQVDKYKNAQGEIVIEAGCICFMDDTKGRIVPVAFVPNADIGNYPAGKLGFLLNTLEPSRKGQARTSSALLLGGVIYTNMLPYQDGLTTSQIIASMATVSRFVMRSYSDVRVPPPPSTY